MIIKDIVLFRTNALIRDSGLVRDNIIDAAITKEMHSNENLETICLMYSY